MPAENTTQPEKRFVPVEAVAACFRGALAVDYKRFDADLDAVADQDATPRA